MSTRTTQPEHTPVLREQAEAIRRACDAYYAEAAKLDGVRLQMLRAFSGPAGSGTTISLVLIAPDDEEGEEVLNMLAQGCKRMLDVLRAWTILEQEYASDNGGR